MSVQIYILETIMSPGFYERDFFVITWRKWKLFVCPFKVFCASAYTSNYVKKSSSFMNNWKKKFYIKNNHYWSFNGNFFVSSLLLCLLLDLFEITFACFLVFLEWKDFGNLTFEKEYLKDLIGYVKNRKGDL